MQLKIKKEFFNREIFKIKDCYMTIWHFPRILIKRRIDNVNHSKIKSKIIELKLSSIVDDNIKDFFIT
jgi:hypothetical protein